MSCASITGRVNGFLCPSGTTQRHQFSHKMSMNKLQLNDDKTEIPLIGSTAGMDLPSPLRVRQSDIPFCDGAHNLCVIFESQLALKEQVNDLCQLAYLEIRQIGSIQHRSHFLLKLPKVPLSLCSH